MSSDIKNEIDVRHLLNYKAYTTAENGIGQNVVLGSTLVPSFLTKTFNYRKALIVMDAGVITGGDSISFVLQVSEDGTTYGTHPDWTTEVFTASRMAGPFVARVDLEKIVGNYIRGRVSAVTGTIVFGAKAILYKPQYLPTYLTFYDLSQDV